jgi:hypothetical protein
MQRHAVHVAKRPDEERQPLRTYESWARRVWVPAMAALVESTSRGAVAVLIGFRISCLSCSNVSQHFGASADSSLRNSYHGPDARKSSVILMQAPSGLNLSFELRTLPKGFGSSFGNSLAHNLVSDLVIQVFRNCWAGL